MPETFYPSVTHGMGCMLLAGRLYEANPRCIIHVLLGACTGTYAEYICVDEEVLCRMPDSMSFQDAAALPLVTLTAWQVVT